MPPDAPIPGTPQGWLGRARGNLARARQPKPKEGFWEDLCFDAQQAAEKAIKAVLVRRGVAFPKTHDIRSLLSLLSKAGETIPSEIAEADNLTDYATDTRYPGNPEPVSEEECSRAVALAERVVRWAEDKIAASEG
jgi:HEPN domain-containing protein